MSTQTPLPEIVAGLDLEPPVWICWKSSLCACLREETFSIEQEEKTCPFLKGKCDPDCTFYSLESEEATDREWRLRELDVAVCNLNLFALLAAEKLRKDLDHL